MEAPHTTPPDIVTRIPRYTSYPPAPHFGGLDASAANDALSEVSGPVSLYLHVPFCHQLCWYCGCNQRVARGSHHGDRLLDGLAIEAGLIAQGLNRPITSRQLHFGGGTPTFLDPEQLRRAVGLLVQVAPAEPGSEWGIELDPRTLRDDTLDALLELGFNRFSLGVQDFDQRVMQSVNRAQPRELTEHVVARIRRANGRSVHFDLMIGLPHQSVEGHRKTLDEVVELRPDRVSVFPYAHVPSMMPAQRLLDESAMPGPEGRVALFEQAATVLMGAGYERVGMDHFSLPTDPLAAAARERRLTRNFQGYSTHAGLDVLGMGPSAISSIGRLYTQNAREEGEWRRLLDAQRLPVVRGLACTDEDLRCRRLISDLLCYGEVEWDEHGGADAWSAALARLRGFEQERCVQRSSGGFALTEHGWSRARHVAALFDRRHQLAA